MTVRRAELLGVLSLAADSGMGHPGDLGLRSCLAALEIAKGAGASAVDVAETFHVSLLRFVGCTADAHVAADVWGDEVRARGWLAFSDFGSAADVMGRVVKNAGAGESPWTRARLIARAFAKMSTLYGTVQAHCEVAQLLAQRLGLDAGVRAAVACVFERWDGKGVPRGLKGEKAPLSARIAGLAHDFALFHSAGGRAGALDVVLRRKGGAHAPELVRVVERDLDRIVAAIEKPGTWQRVMEHDPTPPLDDAQLDEGLAAVGDFADLRSNFTRGHSTHVAALAEAAAAACGLAADDVALTRRAALVHDLGRAAVSVALWDKPAPLLDDEREQVRMHAYIGERCLARAAGLKAIAEVAACAHERLDGAGYHRAFGAASLAAPARILAAADVYQALAAPRPHRPAHEPAAAAEKLRGLARGGSLCADAVRAVLEAAGHSGAATKTVRPSNTKGLSDRELEVLALVAQGMSNKQMADVLGISAKTVDHHVQHIYTKIGVSTRAAATMFAMEHKLVRSR